MNCGQLMLSVQLADFSTIVDVLVILRAKVKRGVEMNDGVAGMDPKLACEVKALTQLALVWLELTLPPNFFIVVIQYKHSYNGYM